MKCDELKSLKNIGLSFDTTTLHKQVIAEDSEGKCYGFDSWEEFYLKSEADKVIAEKDARIAELKKERDWLAKDRAQAYDDLEKRAQLNIRQEESIQHQKYKRCLAMAKWCAADCVVNQNTYKRFLTRKSEFRIDHFRKWYKRWMELAEKFKDKEA